MHSISSIQRSPSTPQARFAGLHKRDGDEHRLVIDGAEVIGDTGQMLGDVVVVKGERIEKIAHRVPLALKLRHDTTYVHAPKGSILTTGLIEQHFHGGYGVSFNLSSVSDMASLVRQLPAIGVTRILPTVMTDSPQKLASALIRLEKLIRLTKQQPDGAQVVGIHLEGPFIHPEKNGAHSVAHIEQANRQGLALLTELLRIAPDIKLVTMAPELDTDGRLTRFLTQRGIRVSAGHTRASATDIQNAFANGVSGLTHTFNQMNPIAHRPAPEAASPIPVALNQPGVFLEIIPDGHHVDPELLKFIMRGHLGKMIPVSDAAPIAHREQKTIATERVVSDMGGVEIVNRGGVAYNALGQMVGSATLLPDCIRNIARWGIAPFGQALSNTSRNISRFLGLGEGAEKIGELKPGYQADLVLWDKNSPDNQVLATWINGKPAYAKVY